MNERKLVAVIACRNSGSRLYGKPLQRLCIDSGWSILDHVIFNLKSLSCINEIVLAISEGINNLPFVEYAKENNIKFVIGDENDVLSRLLNGLGLVNATDLFRVTSESPYLYWQLVEEAWHEHISNDNDATFLDDVVDGCGFEIVKTNALQRSWDEGSEIHRSELCTLYIRKNPEKFAISRVLHPANLCRRDLRLTVDYPEDLIVCRKVYAMFCQDGIPKRLDLHKIIEYLDSASSLKSLTYPYTEAGYSTMYV